ACAVLSRLFGEREAARKVTEIEASLAADHHRPRLADLREPTTGKIRPVVWAGVGLAAFQQLVGINVVFYYGATLWQAVGFSENDALETNVLSGIVAAGSCLLAMALVDKIGRKPLLLVGSAGMAAALAAVAVAFSTAEGSATGAVSLPGHAGP